MKHDLEALRVKPKTPTEALERLRVLLRNPDTLPLIWDFGTLIDHKDGCGSVGCALGAAAMLWGDGGGILTEDIAMDVCDKLFGAGPDGLTGSDMQHIFSAGIGLGEGTARILPGHIADRIDWYLDGARGEYLKGLVNMQLAGLLLE